MFSHEEEKTCVGVILILAAKVRPALPNERKDTDNGALA
jgi:hypothetical protein